MPRPPLLVLLGLLAACDPSEGRAAWLRTTLVLDNQVFLDTDPAQAELKFARMSQDRYAFFRGTLGQYMRDATQAGGPGYVASAHTSADTADIALVGDPHPENIGSFRGADGVLVLDFNDFDAATYGPYHLDVRRLALGFYIAGRELDVAAPELIAEASVAGYVAEIAALAAGAPGIVVAAGGDHGKIVRHLFKKAAEDGAAREELTDYTRVVDGARAMFYGEVEAPVAWQIGEYALSLATDEVVPVTVDEADVLARALAAWPATLADRSVLPADAAALKGLSRRHGAGVASYPAPRFYALLEGRTAAPDDDLLVELKRVYDATPLPGLVRLPSRPFADNGARVVAQQRALQTTPVGDPLLGHASLGGVNFRMRDRSKYQRGVDLAKIAEKFAEDEWHADDLAVLADRAGHLLARAHARAPRQSGEPGLAAIATALADDPADFVAETRAFAVDYAAVVEADYEAFRAALAEVGPSLGYWPSTSP